MSLCGDCNEDRECRPYGENGSMICFDCAIKPEYQDQIEQRFLSRLFKAIENSEHHTAVIGLEAGPIPL